MYTADTDVRILIIDDDTELTSMLRDYLQHEGFAVNIANDPREGLRLAKTNPPPSLILLDVMMPHLNGFEVLRQLRQTHLTPVLMLTAKGDDYDKILGLELGADDYLAKPFNHRELLARISAILRRLALGSRMNSQQDLLVNGISLSMSRQQAACDTQPLSLTSTEFSILHLLMTHAGERVSKIQISEQILEKKLSPYDRSIDMHVSNLRKKLAAVSRDEKIKTVRGAGYLMVTGR